MANRQSALHLAMHSGSYGLEPAKIGLSVDKDLKLTQVAAWPDSVEPVLEQISRSTKLGPIHFGNQATGTASAAVLQIEPLKWWLIGAPFESIPPELGSVLDLSHSRTRLRIEGPEASKLLNRFLPIDLRDHCFPINALASSAIHHIGVTLWRSDKAFELFIPRGYAESIYELIFETALQFGVNVK